jgi:hypothetical protein
MHSETLTGGVLTPQDSKIEQYYFDECLEVCDPLPKSPITGAVSVWREMMLGGERFDLGQKKQILCMPKTTKGGEVTLP